MLATYTIHVISYFTASRALRDYIGSCAQQHTQTFKVAVDVLTPEPDEKGFVIDFYEIKAALEKIIAEFEQRYLNDMVPFNTLNPSNENLAKHIFWQLSTGLQSSQVKVTAISVWENDAAGVTYKI